MSGQALSMETAKKKHDNFMDFFASIDDKAAFHSMNEVIPNLWLGSMVAALAVRTLHAHGVTKILSAIDTRPSLPDVCINNVPFNLPILKVS